MINKENILDQLRNAFYVNEYPNTIFLTDHLMWSLKGHDNIENYSEMNEWRNAKVILARVHNVLAKSWANREIYEDTQLMEKGEF